MCPTFFKGADCCFGLINENLVIFVGARMEFLSCKVFSTI
jgi:hypothetical protein